MKHLINFIDKDEDKQNTMHGMWLVIMLVVTQLIAYIMSEHLVLYQKMIGVKSSNALIALIYEK